MLDSIFKKQYNYSNKLEKKEGCTVHSENKLRVAVNTKDKFLYRKIMLDIMEIAEATLVTDADGGDFDICFFYVFIAIHIFSSEICTT